MNKNIKKIISNKVFLFIVPHLVYLIYFFNIYNVNYHSLTEILFSDVLIVSLFYFFITLLIYIFLSIALKNKKKVFIIQFVICLFYFNRFSFFSFLIFVLFCLLLVFVFKKYLYLNLDGIIVFSSFFLIILFSCNFSISFYNFLSLVFSSKNFEYKVDVDTSYDGDGPNVYWIHCDGMMGPKAILEYFNYYPYPLDYYFKENGYFYNDDAVLIGGHKTQKALVALFNPYYYDHFYHKYLSSLNDYELGLKGKINFDVSYYELLDKRLNNELFGAFKEKGYSTVAISEFNSYTAFLSDYYYDYYKYHWDYLSDNDFRLIEDKNYLKLMSYLRFDHLKPILNETNFYHLTDLNYLNNKVIDYSDINVDNYQHSFDIYSNNGYWVNMAILKGIDEVSDIDEKKFVFVDFRVNHDPFLFNSNGGILDKKVRKSAMSYSGNYAYSIYLLMDILNYIKSVDSNAVIVVQGDHGLHSLSNDEMIQYFNVDLDGINRIRNSVISAVYVPEHYRNGDEKYLSNPLNISRYLVNNFVGYNYNYLS